MKLEHALGNTWYLEGVELIPLYRVDEKRCILLDCGLLREQEELTAALEEAGLVPVGVLGSHVHVDHWDNAGYLRQRYGARLALPEGEAAITACPELLRSIYGMPPPGLLDRHYAQLHGRVDQTVGPEDGTVDFCGVPFQVIHIPGHSPDQIAIATPDGVCYLADGAFTPDFLAQSKLSYHGNHSLAKVSMEKLRGLNYPLYLAAHRGTAEDIGALVDANLIRLNEMGEEILAQVEGVMTIDQIACRVLDRLRLFTSKEDKAAIYERNIRTFVNELWDQGKLVLEIQHGMLCYRRAGR